MSNCKMPYLDWQYAPLVESYKALKARMELYFIDHAIIDDNKKEVKIKIASGDEGMRRLLASGLSQKQPQYIAIYRLLTAALFSMSHHYNHNGQQIKITF